MKITVTKALLGAAVFATALLLVQQNQAWALSGPCNSCHTMHNSQDGTNMGTASANDYLLQNTCAGCHKQDAAFGLTNSIPAPVVWHTDEPNTIPDNGGGAGNHLAGGDFYWVAPTEGADDRAGHNVDLVGNVQDSFINDYTPPGNGSTTWTTQLTCDDAFGCHIGAGAHHINQGGDFTADATTAVWVHGADKGDSYRFLDSNGPSTAGGYIVGAEDNDYEFSVSNQDHNVYFGYNDYDTGSIDHMAGLCARCHGDFHGSAAYDAGTQPQGGTGGSPWIRHPTDFRLSAATGSSEYDAYNTYDWVAPVAVDSDTSNSFGGGNGAFSTIKAGWDNVTCVSCHRAHGSGFADLLRWSYGLMDANNQPDYGALVANSGRLGCFACHSTK